MAQASLKSGAVVYLGAGLCSDLDRYLTAQPERVYLVEPNPDLKEDLTLLCEAHPNVDHLAYGVSVKGGQQKLNVFNFFDLSSFSAPEHLLKTYPGALCEKTPTVKTVTPKQLLADLDLPQGKPHTLVINTPGLEHDLLDAFITGDLLNRFARLILSVPAHPLFKDSRDIADTDALLIDAGFRQRPAVENPAHTGSNPDWRTRLYVFDPKTDITPLFEDGSLEDRNKALQVTLEKTLRTLNSKTTELEALKETAQKQSDTATSLAELRAELTMALRVQTHLQSSLTDLQTRYQALISEKTTQDAFLVTLAQGLEGAMIPSEGAQAAAQPAQKKPKAKKT